MDSDPFLPMKAGPVPDRLAIWPVDDGRYGLDATFQGASGLAELGPVLRLVAAFVVSARVDPDRNLPRCSHVLAFRRGQQLLSCIDD